MDNKTARVPIWGILSVALAPLAEISVTIAAIAADALVTKPPGVSMTAHIPVITYAAVLWTILCLGTGLLAGVAALVLRERPRWLPIAGIASTLGLIALFIYVTSAD